MSSKTSSQISLHIHTSNYILSTMDKENKNFEDVLLDAKKLGYAESNPSSDINGDDVAAK